MELPAPQLRVKGMTKLVLPLAATLLLGAALGVSAAPKKPAPAKPSPVVPLTDPAYKAVDTLEGAGVAVLPFSDVPPNHWAAKAVETLHQAGIVRGYSGGGYQIGQTRK